MIAECLRLYQFDFGYGERGDLHAAILPICLEDAAGYSMRLESGTTGKRRPVPPIGLKAGNRLKFLEL